MFGEGDPPEAAFLVVHTRGVGTLAPVARVEPPFAVLLWLEHRPGRSDAMVANALLTALRDRDVPTLAIKQGSVGGPAGRDGCVDVEEPLVAAVLAAEATGDVLWERDPDFGYEVPGRVRGIERDAGRILLPRLLYGDHDRVYEHASLVAAKKRERFELAQALSGLDPAIAEAAGWPPPVTGSEWRG